MKTLSVSRFAGLATLALGALPIAALTTAAHAQTAHQRVMVSDLNLSSASGQAAFATRVDDAARHFCRDERDLTLKAACQAGVRVEASEKVSATTQYASR